MPTLVVILGPTGVGKTELSLRLAEEYGCPIVSADSRQIYRDLPIGTAAPTPGIRPSPMASILGKEGFACSIM